MNLDKAIELIQHWQAGGTASSWQDLKQAIILTTEASKRILEGRRKGYDFFGHSLPGETP